MQYWKKNDFSTSGQSALREVVDSTNDQKVIR